MNIMIRLRELREKSKLTLEEVAKALGLKNQYVSNYELEKRRPDYETLKKFAEFYNVSIDYILGRDDSEDIEYMRIAKKAKKDGFTPEELDKALELLNLARKNDKK